MFSSSVSSIAILLLLVHPNGHSQPAWEPSKTPTRMRIPNV